MTSSTRPRRPRSPSGSGTRKGRDPLGFCQLCHLHELDPEILQPLLGTLHDEAGPLQCRTLWMLTESNFSKEVDRYGLPHDPAVCIPILTNVAKRTASGMKGVPFKQLQSRWIAQLRAIQRSLPQLWERHRERPKTAPVRQGPRPMLDLG